MNFKELLNRKVFGIPVVWIALAVSVVAVYAAIKLKPAEEPTEEEVPTEEETPEFDGDDGEIQQPVFVANPPQQPGPSPDTDEKWARRCIDWLRAGGTSVELATAGITKYLNEEPLTEAERAVVNRAIAEFGLPPESVPNTPTVPPRNPSTNYSGPFTRQGTPPLTHKIKGKSDDTVAELAQGYYGSSAPDYINLIKGGNLRNPGPYRIGQGVYIPKYRNPRYYTAKAGTQDQYAIARKNGTTAAKILEYNNGMKFPVKVGTRVRVE